MTNAVAISAQTERNRLAFYRHSLDPRVLGPWEESFYGFRLVYEAKAAIRARNPIFATRLLPTIGDAVTGYPGLVVRPVGVVVEIDKTAANTVTLTLDVAGALALTVTAPAGQVQTLTPTATATRNTAVFAATSDGLYEVRATLGGALVTTLLVVVQREAELRLAEDSRTTDGGWAFKSNRRPKASPVFTTRLFLIITKEAAAAVNDRETFFQLDAAEKALPTSAVPTALFPAHA